MKVLGIRALTWCLSALCIFTTVGCATVEEAPPEPATKPVVMSATTLQKVYPGQPSYQDIVMEKGITYATVDGRDLKLNLARPVAYEKPLPGVVFLAPQNRGLMDKNVSLAATRGYVGVTIDRRGYTYRFPAQVNDVSCAIRWLRAKAEKYGLDPSRIGVMGEGRADAGYQDGGYLALMIGFIDETHRLYGNCGDSKQSSRVQAVISMAGYSDAKRFYETRDWYHGRKDEEAFEQHLGGTPEEVPERYKEASPITYISADDPPVLSLFQEGSGFFPFEQVEILDAKLKEFGVPHIVLQYIRVAGSISRGTLMTVPQSDNEERGLVSDAM